MDNKDIPKTIWFLWLQGLDKAPVVVQKCYASWLKHNPGWNVIFLDEKNLTDYISLKPRQTTRQALSDILRINLLAKHGGLWVDATCFCTKPLDDWLYNNMVSGFFAFNRPGPDRMLSSWFMAGSKDNYITHIYQTAVDAYWDANPNIAFFEISRWYFLNRYLRRMKVQTWFGSFATKILKVYPYFWFHYLFESIYLNDKRIRDMWDTTPKISADIPHKLQFAGLFNPLTDEIKTEIDNKIAPVYKLTWKYNEANYKKGTIIDYLLK
ncbi:MAG: Capsular polysaccharide synthesis protein [Mucilaginibacter sp.]|nr:Capsular polysaccharide synthesis protein [Mucilaginibacter sp.]